MKSEGSTPSEKFLAHLAKKSFLDLWSYPNVYRKKAKELCDLLVVCGSYILIFSDKTINWSNMVDAQIAWQRWYRKAVKDSIHQIEGAIRAIENSPDKLYLDPNCNIPFPLSLPASPQKKIISIIVANGSEEANRRILGEGTGSLLLMPRIKGDEHLNGFLSDDLNPFVNDNEYLKAPCIPFAIGDVNPNKAFMHVLDRVSLQIVMEELDTITDFIQYFEKREKFIRSEKLISAFGEEDLLAYYLSNINENEEHDFTIPEGKEEKVVIPGGLYNSWKAGRPYEEKMKANRISYIWDKIISYYTEIFKMGRYNTLSGDKLSTHQIELSLRYMAMECRVKRRMLVSEFMDAMRKGVNYDRTRRLVLSSNYNHYGVAYCFLTLKYPKDLPLEGGYEQYRTTRKNMLYGNCLAALRRYQNIKILIGITSEPFSEDSNNGTQDLLWMEQPEWTDERIEELKKYISTYNISILSEAEINHEEICVDEYPL